MPGFALLLADAPKSPNLLGNFAYVRGMIEAGVQVATCYPGSPTAEMISALMDIGAKAGIYFEISTNEKVALEVAATSAIAGRPSVMWMKSVGLNVAADTAVQLPYFTMPGGLVVILGDDPGHLSSQNEQDNRHYARMGYLPFLEPATPQEAKDYFVYGMELSQKLKMPVFIRSTTRTCHQIGPVSYGPKRVWQKAPAWDNELMKRDGGYVPLPGTLEVLKAKALDRLEKAGAEIEASGLNQVVKVGEGDRLIRIISFGHTFQSIVSAVEHLGARAEILKLAQSFPLPVGTIVEFLKRGAEVHILEELDPVLETEIKALCYDLGLSTKVIGKLGREDGQELQIGEFQPTRAVEIIAGRLGMDPGLSFVESSFALPSRSPTLCPGCGHRTAFYAVKKAIGKDKEAFTMADIGCYSLGYLPPFSLGNLLYCMGSGAPAASAMAKAFPDEPVMSFVGDATFFHAAMPGIANAVYNNHRQVIMVMDNGTTAMTGHQPNPNTGVNVRGEQVKLSIDDILKGMGVRFVERIPALDCAVLEDAMKRALEFAKSPEGGVAVVIPYEPSALPRSREELKAGTLPNPFAINHKLCRNIEECLQKFSCPAIGMGKEGQSEINTDLCVGCASCVQVCPMLDKPIEQLEEFERV